MQRSNRYLPTPGGPDNSAALKKAPVSFLDQGPGKKKKVSASTGSPRIKFGKRKEKGQGISMIQVFNIIYINTFI